MGGPGWPRQSLPGVGRAHADPERARDAVPECDGRAVGRQWIWSGYRFVYPGRDALASQYFTYGVYLQNTPGNPLGETRQITQNITDEGTLGIKADLGGSWKLDGYVQKGDTVQKYIDNNGTRVDRLFLSMDAVADSSGNPVCRVSSPTLQPDVLQELRGLRADQPVRRLDQHLAAGGCVRQWSAEDRHSALRPHQR